MLKYRVNAVLYFIIIQTNSRRIHLHLGEKVFSPIHTLPDGSPPPRAHWKQDENHAVLTRKCTAGPAAVRRARLPGTLATRCAAASRARSRPTRSRAWCRSTRTRVPTGPGGPGCRGSCAATSSSCPAGAVGCCCCFRRRCCCCCCCPAWRHSEHSHRGTDDSALRVPFDAKPLRVHPVTTRVGPVSQRDRG